MFSVQSPWNEAIGLLGGRSATEETQISGVTCHSPTLSLCLLTSPRSVVGGYVIGCIVCLPVYENYEWISIRISGVRRVIMNIKAKLCYHTVILFAAKQVKLYLTNLNLQVSMHVLMQQDTDHV